MIETNKYTKRFVCCVDILGFANKFSGFSSEEKIKEYLEILEIYKASCHTLINYTSPNPSYSNKRVNFHWFSDTFILFSNEMDELNDIVVFNFLHSIKIFFRLLLKRGYPLRGGIDFGEFIIDQEENIFIGQALINAYKSAEAHDWAGIVISDNAYTTISSIKKGEKHIIKNIRDLSIYYDVPLKDRTKEKHRVINWPKNGTIIPNIEGIIEDAFKKYCMSSKFTEQIKLDNTIRFAKFSLEKK